MNTIRNYKDQWVALSQPQKIAKLKIVAGVCYAFFLFLFVIFAFGGTRRAERSPTNVVLFTEATPDALQSIKYLALRADIAVRMIIVGSSSWSQNAFQSTIAISGFVSMLQREKILSASIPVYYGSSLSISDCAFSREINFSKPPTSPSAASTFTACTYSRAFSPKERFMGERLFGVSEILSAEGESTSCTYFSTALEELVNSTKVQFLILGPATDAALFLQQSSNSLVRANVEGITIAGGAFISNGNAHTLETTNRVAEINFFLDPQAASYIVSGLHGRPVTVIPLDAIFQWDSSVYNTVITLPSSAFSLQKNSSTTVGFALTSFYKVFPHLSSNITVNFLATAYLADASLQASSIVSIFPVEVTTEGSLNTVGKSVYNATKTFSSTVVLSVKKKLFWDGIIRLNPLAS